MEKVKTLLKENNINFTDTTFNTEDGIGEQPFVSIVVSQKSILQVCQRGGWALFRMFLNYHKRVLVSCLLALEANSRTNNNLQQKPTSGFKVES